MKFIIPGFEIIYCCLDILLFYHFIFSQARNREVGGRLLDFDICSFASKDWPTVYTS